jgi:hypothetical protein
MAGARSATAFDPSPRIRLISPRLASVGAKELHKRDVKLLKSLERVHFLRGRDARPDVGDLTRSTPRKLPSMSTGLKVAPTLNRFGAGEK